ncbi:MAG: class I SAM-dependent methyltransferase [Anaerolineae bacterium]|jgi:2-polyprenyl-3-methyl-5-hydroxy-6-metoxy-1,4-benzoquinol methylase|nr:class I SAM-dependent methyltransferase [Anaerolineae bacterium]
MTPQDRLYWDQVYQARGKQPYPDSDPLLYEYVPIAPSNEMRALDLACGVGQNGLWIAKQGYTVDLIDISRNALSLARREIEQRRVTSVNLLQADLDQERFPRERYDVVIVFRYHHAALLPQLVNTVRPSGRIISLTFNHRYRDQATPIERPFIVEPGEWRLACSGWKILLDSDEGHFAHFVAIKH